MPFSDKLNRLVDMHVWEREYYDWLKQPPWVRYADSNDRIAGFDEEPGKPQDPKEFEEAFELMYGHKPGTLKGLPY